MQDDFQSQSDQVRECRRVSKLWPKSGDAPSKHDSTGPDRAIHANLKGGQKEMSQIPNRFPPTKELFEECVEALSKDTAANYLKRRRKK